MSSGYVFCSDLWSTATDNLKSHDLQFWHELVFNDTMASADVSPEIKQLIWEKEIVLNIAMPSL